MRLFPLSLTSDKEQSTEDSNGGMLYLNVYDISPANNYLYWVGLGIFHSGIEVNGMEYGFGAHEYPTSGVFEVEPKNCPGFIFRRSVLMGNTKMSHSELTGKPIPGWVNRLARVGSFCHCLLPENIQVTAVRHLPDRPADSDDDDRSGSLMPSLSAESERADADHHLLATPNGDLAFLKEKPVRLARELM